MSIDGPEAQSDQTKETDAAGNGSALSRRNQYAGLKSDTFGTLLVGRHDTPVKVIGRKADLFWSTQLGQNRSDTAQTEGVDHSTPRFPDSEGAHFTCRTR